MTHLPSHNPLFLPSRPIFFADQKARPHDPNQPLPVAEEPKPEEPKKPEPPKPKPKETSLNSTQKRRIAALKLGDDFKFTPDFRDEDLEKLYNLFEKNDKFQDITDPSSPYKHLIDSIKKKKIKKGETAVRFYKAITGGSSGEKKYIQGILKEIKEDSSVPKQESVYLKKLAEFAGLSEEEAEAKTKKTEAETQKKAQKIMESVKKQKKLVFTPESFPKELAEQRESIYKEAEVLMANHIETDNKITELNQALREPNIEKARKQALKEEIKAKEHELDQLEQQIDALSEQAKPLDKKIRQYIKRNLARFRDLDHVANQLGIDLRDCDELRFWFLRPDYLQEQTTPPLSSDLQGLEVSKSGEARKKLKSIKINKIYYDKSALEVAPREEDAFEELQGKLMVEYVDENGDTAVSPYKNFLDFINGFEGFKEMDSLEELNQAIAPNTWYAGVKENQHYSAQVLTGFDKEGKKVFRTDSFQIETIVDSGMERKIVLDRVVIKTPKEWIGRNQDEDLYFDRTAKEFSFGEFAKFVKQYDYKRNLDANLNPEDAQKILDNMGEYRKAQNESMNQNLSEDQRKIAEQNIKNLKYRFELPKIGETVAVDVNDGYDNPRLAHLTQDAPHNNQSRFTLEHDTGNKSKAELTLPKLLEMAANNKIQNTVPEKSEAVTSTEDEKKKELDDIMRKTGVAGGLDGPDDGGSKKESDTSGPDPEKTLEEIQKLPYQGDLSKAYKAGGMDVKTQGYVSKLFSKTRLITFGDYIQFGKIFYEYLVRWWDRRQKDRVGWLGKQLPFIGSEFRRIEQHSEDEEVNQFKSSMEEMPIDHVEHIMLTTGNKDEMKACFMHLAGKGHIRWDNVELWENINRQTRKFSVAKCIPIPPDGDPAHEMGEDDSRTGYDFLGGALDAVWGENTFNEWKNTNESKYDSLSKEFYPDHDKLNIVPGGYTKVLGGLLEKHKKCKFVDPHEYESCLTHCIEKGKADLPTKIYFLIAGLAAKNDEGRTILDITRIGTLSIRLANALPVFEWFRLSAPRYEKDPVSGVYKLSEKTKPLRFPDYKYLLDKFDAYRDEKGDKPALSSTGLASNQNLKEFIWVDILASNKVQERINKALRNPQDIDHEDAYFLVPSGGEEIVKKVCSPYSGRRSGLTQEAYGNIFVGFTDLMKAITKRGDKDSKRFLKETISSYFWYSAILNRRYKQDDETYSRLDPRKRDRPPIVGKQTYTTQDYINISEDVVKQVVAAYVATGTEKGKKLGKLYEESMKSTSDVPEKDLKEFKEHTDYCIKNFSEAFNEAFKEDEGEAMMRVAKQQSFKKPGDTGPDEAPDI